MQPPRHHFVTVPQVAPHTILLLRLAMVKGNETLCYGTHLETVYIYIVGWEQKIISLALNTLATSHNISTKLIHQKLIQAFYCLAHNLLSNDKTSLVNLNRLCLVTLCVNNRIECKLCENCSSCLGRGIFDFRCVYQIGFIEECLL